MCRGRGFPYKFRWFFCVTFILDLCQGLVSVELVPAVGWIITCRELSNGCYCGCIGLKSMIQWPLLLNPSVGWAIITCLGLSVVGVFLHVAVVVLAPVNATSSPWGCFEKLGQWATKCPTMKQCSQVTLDVTFVWLQRVVIRLSRQPIMWSNWLVKASGSTISILLEAFMYAELSLLSMMVSGHHVLWGFRLHLHIFFEAPCGSNIDRYLCGVV